MDEDEYEVTIGVGGWALVALSCMITFAVLRSVMQFLLFPSVVFAIAIALIVMLLLYWLAGKVSSEEEDTALRVRKIVPASSEVRLDGVVAPAVKAVPVRPEALKAQRPSSVVTPLSAVEPAPIIAGPAMPVAAPVEEAAPAAPIAEPAAPAGTRPTAKPKAAKAAAKPKAEAKPKSEKPKAAKPGAAKPGAEKAGAEKAGTEQAGVAKAGTRKPKAEKAAAPVGLVRLKAPRKGGADPLQEIEGIGPALEKLVNSIGFYHFDQIAAWTEADVAAVDAEMKNFKGRILRDRWVEQARIIVAEGLEAFRERARTNDY